MFFEANRFQVIYWTADPVRKSTSELVPKTSTSVHDGHEQHQLATPSTRPRPVCVHPCHAPRHGSACASPDRALLARRRHRRRGCSAGRLRVVRCGLQGGALRGSAAGVWRRVYPVTRHAAARGRDTETECNNASISFIQIINGMVRVHVLIVCVAVYTRYRSSTSVSCSMPTTPR